MIGKVIGLVMLSLIAYGLYYMAVHEPGGSQGPREHYTGIITNVVAFTAECGFGGGGTCTYYRLNVTADDGSIHHFTADCSLFHAGQQVPLQLFSDGSWYFDGTPDGCNVGRGQ